MPSLLYASLISYLLYLVLISTMLTCASVVSWSHMYSHIHACMISHGSACIPSLVCVCGLVYVSLVTYALS